MGDLIDVVYAWDDQFQQGYPLVGASETPAEIVEELALNWVRRFPSDIVMVL